MHSEIIRRHNERVTNNDIVFFLGDLGFYASANKEDRGEGAPVRSIDLLSQMNGQFYRVRGNHDKQSNKLYIPVKSINLDISGLKIQLIHRPEEADIENNHLIIHGHTHSQLPTQEKLNSYKIPVFFINVSIEQKDYYPFTWDELKAIYDRWLHNHKNRKDIQRCLLMQLPKNKLEIVSSNI